MVSILEKLKKLLPSSGDRSVLGVDIGSSAIKIVQITKRSRKLVLENYGALALGPYAGLSVGQATNASISKLVEALLDLIRETGVSTKNAGFAIPLKDTMISLIEMPDVGEKQLNTMIPIEARKHIPVPISEVVLDFLIMPKKQSAPTKVKIQNKDSVSPNMLDKVDVLLVAIHNDSIDKYQSVRDKAGLSAKMIEVEAFSTLRALTVGDSSVVAILDIGASVTKVTIIENGTLRESHLVNRGSQGITITLSKSLGVDIDRAEAVKRDPTLLNENLREQFGDIVSVPLGYIYSEVESILFEYEKNSNKVVNKIILSGGGVLLSGALEMAKDNFKIPVLIGSPFDRLDTPAFLSNTLKEVGPEFTVAVGLALGAV